MTKLLHHLFAFVLLLATGSSVRAQMTKDPTTWTFEAKKVKGDEYVLTAHLKLAEHWHIWSFTPGGDGMQVPPAFRFNKLPGMQLNGKTTEHGKAISGPMDGVDGDVTYFVNGVDYTQKATITQNGKITGTYTYQVCNESMCLPPKDKKFSIDITDASGGNAAVADTAAAATSTTAATEDTTGKAAALAAATPEATKPAASTAAMSSGTETKAGSNSLEGKSLSLIMLICFLAGLASVITPCVFSMVPITVSFFLKQSEKKSQGIRNAIYYSVSIIAIFTLIGLVISALLGKNAPNFIATNWIVNMVFFIIFILFGLSFLGAFEITLPSSWTSKTDSKANTKSFSGIFFMALTLVIVSFSCTGPIVGSLLFGSLSQGRFVPAMGMFSFSTGLALPFALFAIFPGYLQKLGKAGGWLNSVKVIFGFVELALALKFLSNADLAMGWRLLDREIYIVCWIVIFTMATLYLLGVIRFSHDSELPKNMFGLPYLTVTRLMFAIGSLCFVFYLLPGIWGAPLNGLGAFVPPMGTQDFVLGSNTGGSHESDNINPGIRPVKYAEAMRIYEPEVVKKFGLVTFFDYEEALEASRKTGKPLMLDFTGINCVNCRKMETQVWSKPEVMKILKEDFIIASLYCDYDKEKLPKEQQYYSKVLEADVVSVGDRNEDIQATKFGSNSQPYYFFVDADGNKLADQGYGYDPDVAKFVKHLESVKAKYKALHP